MRPGSSGWGQGRRRIGGSPRTADLPSAGSGKLPCTTRLIVGNALTGHCFLAPAFAGFPVSALQDGPLCPGLRPKSACHCAGVVGTCLRWPGYLLWNYPYWPDRAAELPVPWDPFEGGQGQRGGSFHPQGRRQQSGSLGSQHQLTSPHAVVSWEVICSWFACCLYN